MSIFFSGDNTYWMHASVIWSLSTGQIINSITTAGCQRIYNRGRFLCANFTGQGHARKKG